MNDEKPQTHTMTATEVSRIGKTRGTMRSIEALTKVNTLLDRTKKSPSEVSQLLGYAAGAVNHWNSEGNAPIVAGLAAEAHLSRFGGIKERLFFFKLSSTQKEAETIMLILERMGVRVREL